MQTHCPLPVLWCFGWFRSGSGRFWVVGRCVSASQWQGTGETGSTVEHRDRIQNRENYGCGHGVLKSHLSTSRPWDLNLEKIWLVVNGKGQIIFYPVWLVPWITHMTAGNLTGNFSCNESRIVSSNNKAKQCFLLQRSRLIADNIHHQYKHGRQPDRFHSVFPGRRGKD